MQRVSYTDNFTLVNLKCQGEIKSVRRKIPTIKYLFYSLLFCRNVV